MHALQSFPRSSPEQQGMSSSAISGFLAAIEQQKIELHSVMVVRHGHILAEGWWAPYHSDRPHHLFSLSKSFTSTAIGFAVTEGLLSLDDTVVSFFPEETPAQVSPNLAAMQIRHLLMMGTGHGKDTMEAINQDLTGDWVKTFLHCPVEYEPGTFFLYNTGATYMLSAILNKVTGISLQDYLEPRLFKPLGILNPTWTSCPRGINVGGWGLNITTEDIAKFGQLYLQQGMWQGVQLLPEAWVKEASSKQITNGDDPLNDWNQGYGYQFWMCRHGGYRGDGAFGQYCIVLPEQDAVIAITSGNGDMQITLNAVWEHLLPAMQENPLPANEGDATRLAKQLAALSYMPIHIQKTSPLASQYSGTRYTLEDNELGLTALAIETETDAILTTIWSSQGEGTIRAGLGEWMESSCFFMDSYRQLVASATWQEENSLLITTRLIETPFYYTLTVVFEDEQIKLLVTQNVSFGPTEWPPILGKAQA